MPKLIIEAVPACEGRPSHIKIASDSQNPAEAVVLLERAKVSLLSQNVPALDGEPDMIITEAPVRVLSGRGPT